MVRVTIVGVDPVIALEYGHGDGRYAPISLGAGAWLPDRFRVLLNDPARIVVSVVDLTVDEHGRARVQAVTQTPRGDGTLTPDDFRVPIARIIDAALATLTLRGPVRPPGARLGDAEVLGDPHGALVIDVLRGRRRRVLTAELLAEVADVYQQARRDGTPVRVAVAERWILPLNTARNWIDAARRAGLIAPPG